MNIVDCLPPAVYDLALLKTSEIWLKKGFTKMKFSSIKCANCINHFC